MIQLAVTNDSPQIAPDVAIIPTTPHHIIELSETIREEDMAEIENYGIPCAEGLWHSYRYGLGNKTAIIDGEVAAVWGVGGNYLGSVGRPWLLTSNAVHKISPLKFARIYQKEVYAMLEMFDRLENMVDDKYEKSKRMLSIVGFTLGEPEKWGQGMFRKFSMERA